MREGGVFTDRLWKTVRPIFQLSNTFGGLGLWLRVRVLGSVDFNLTLTVIRQCNTNPTLTLIVALNPNLI